MPVMIPLEVGSFPIQWGAVMPHRAVGLKVPVCMGKIVAKLVERSRPDAIFILQRIQMLTVFAFIRRLFLAWLGMQ